MSDFEAQHSRAFGSSLVFCFIKEEAKWCFSFVTCWWILETLLSTFCSISSLYCFSSKIYLYLISLYLEYMILGRVGEGPSMSRYFALISAEVGYFHVKWYSSSISTWHNPHILSSLKTLLVRPFSISSWWDSLLSCPMTTLTAFGRNASRYFGRVINLT